MDATSRGGRDPRWPCSAPHRPERPRADLVVGLVDARLDALVSGAPAQVPGDRLAQRHEAAVLAEVRLGGDEHPRRADAALSAAVIDERALERREALPLGEP